MPALKGKPSWNAGTAQGWIDKRGYRWIYVTENGKRRAKREHRHIMEQRLGRKLEPDELVHHVNGNKADNRVENLAIEEWGKHSTEHLTGTKRTDSAKKTVQVMANYREEHQRLREINAKLLEALESLLDMDGPIPCLKLVVQSVDIIKARAAIAAAKGEA